MRTLSRHKIVDAGLGLMDREGTDAVTMRVLAQQLGVTPMALYNHFGNKRDLLRGIAEHVISQAEFDGGHANWKDQLRHCFRTLREICLRHPGLPRLLEVEGAAPASVLRPMEVAVEALQAAHLDEINSLRTYFVLVGFTLSLAGYQAREPVPGLHVTDDWDYEASFEYGLELIISGIAATTGRHRR